MHALRIGAALPVSAWSARIPAHFMKLRSFLILTASASLAVLTTACQRQPATSPPSAASSTNQQVFAVNGVVRELQPERKKIKIEHEEIPGYMARMTMLFDVKDANELDGLQTNDTVAFRMIVTADDGWIDQIKKTGATTNAPPPAAESFRRVRDVEPLVVGDRMPDYTFTNEMGQAMHLRDLKDQAYALTFIFTRCPFPTFCPQLSKSFQSAQATLKAMTNGPSNWRLLSLTIDPQFDTPAVLKAYAKRYGADPAHWSFLTGSLADIDAISEQFGLQFWRTSPEALPNHNVRTVVVDAAGRVQWMTPENEWKPAALVEQIVRGTAAN